MAVCISGESRPLITLPKLLDGEQPHESSRSDLAADKRFHFIPGAQLIVAIPKANDRLLLRRFDILRTMKEGDIDYLFVASSPVTSASRAVPMPIRSASSRNAGT